MEAKLYKKPNRRVLRIETAEVHQILRITLLLNNDWRHKPHPFWCFMKWNRHDKGFILESMWFQIDYIDYKEK